jgi:hypothetical protein
MWEFPGTGGRRREAARNKAYLRVRQNDQMEHFDGAAAESSRFFLHLPLAEGQKLQGSSKTLQVPLEYLHPPGEQAFSAPSRISAEAKEASTPIDLANEISTPSWETGLRRK